MEVADGVLVEVLVCVPVAEAEGDAEALAVEVDVPLPEDVMEGLVEGLAPKLKEAEAVAV